MLRQFGLLWPSLLQTKHLESRVSVLILNSLPLIKGVLRDETVHGRADEEGNPEIVVARHSSGARERGREGFDAEWVANFAWEGAIFCEFID